MYKLGAIHESTYAKICQVLTPLPPVRSAYALVWTHVPPVRSAYALVWTPLPPVRTYAIFMDI